MNNYSRLRDFACDVSFIITNYLIWAEMVRKDKHSKRVLSIRIGKNQAWWYDLLGWTLLSTNIEKGKRPTEQIYKKFLTCKSRSIELTGIPNDWINRINCSTSRSRTAAKASLRVDAVTSDPSMRSLSQSGSSNASSWVSIRKACGEKVGYGLIVQKGVWIQKNK